MRHLFCLSATLLLVPVSLSAVDIDMRLGYSLRAPNADFSASGVTDSDSWDSSNRILLGVIVQPTPALTGAWLAGARVVYDVNSRKESGQDQDYTNLALHIQGGYGWFLTPTVRLELMPYVGVGYATLDTGNDDGGGNSVEFGVDVNAAVTLPGGFQMGASVGVASTAASVSLDAGTVDIDQMGLIGGIFLGYRL